MYSCPSIHRELVLRFPPIPGIPKSEAAQVPYIKYYGLKKKKPMVLHITFAKVHLLPYTFKSLDYL